jgi:hypothetical protein
MTWTHEQAHHALVCLSYGALLPPQPSLHAVPPHQVLREYIDQQRAQSPDGALTPPVSEPKAPDVDRMPLGRVGGDRCGWHFDDLEDAWVHESGAVVHNREDGNPYRLWRWYPADATDDDVCPIENAAHHMPAAMALALSCGRREMLHTDDDRAGIPTSGKLIHAAPIKPQRDREQAARRLEAVKVLQGVLDAESHVQSYTAPNTQRREMAEKFLTLAKSTVMSWRENKDAAVKAAGHLASAINVVRGV